MIRFSKEKILLFGQILAETTEKSTSGPPDGRRCFCACIQICAGLSVNRRRALSYAP